MTGTVNRSLPIRNEVDSVDQNITGIQTPCSRREADVPMSSGRSASSQRDLIDRNHELAGLHVMAATDARTGSASTVSGLVDRLRIIHGPVCIQEPFEAPLWSPQSGDTLLH